MILDDYRAPWATQELDDLRGLARTFIAKEVVPNQERWAAAHMVDREFWRAAGRAGLLCISIPEEYGGGGATFAHEAVIAEEQARVGDDAWANMVHSTIVAHYINAFGTEEQKQRWLPGMASGDLVGAIAMTEPGAGSDALGSMATTARRDGDDYIINGSKIYITNGPIADVVLLYAKTDKSKGAKGISAFIIETDNPGFKVAQKLDKMGFRGSPTGELVFDECRVPASAMVGAENSGVSVVMSGLDLERAMVTSVCVGMAERALELGLEYAKIREQFGKPIASFQMVQSKLAEIYPEVETARAFSYRALAACVGLPKGAGGRGEIHKLTAAACLYAGEAFNKAVTEACHIHGGSGYMQDTEINRLFRANKLLEIGAGTSEVRKIIIAEELLRA